MPSTLGIVASGVWTPAELAPDLWLDAADASTITESGGSVSQWDDKSGNGRNFTQSNAANQPTTGIATQNGLNTLTFSGSQEIRNASYDVEDPCTVVWVFDRDSEATVVIYDGVSGGRLISYFASGFWRYYQGTVVTSTSNESDCAVFATIHNGANSLMRINGSQVASGNPGSQDNTGLRIGRNIFDGQGIVGNLCEFMIFSRALTIGDLQLLESYAQSKWGI